MTAAPLWKSVYEALAEEVKSYHYGDRFYSLREICDQFDVSQITARRAINELRSANLVRSIPKRGTVVIRRSEAASLFLIMKRQVDAAEVHSNPLIMRLHHGLSAEAERLGIQFSTCSESVLPLMQKGPDKTGLLVLQSLSEESMRRIRELGLPTVILHPPQARLPESTYIGVDMKHGAHEATSHLAKLGHRRIALLGGKITNPFLLPRFQGYQEALEAADLAFDWSLVRETSGADLQEDRAALDDLFSQRNPPTGIFACSDFRAMHILMWASERGLRVPEDLSIVGYDNISESAMTTPRLTTIDTRLGHLGAEAMHLLLEIMAGHTNAATSSRLIPPQLILRESTISLA